MVKNFAFVFKLILFVDWFFDDSLSESTDDNKTQKKTLFWGSENDQQTIKMLVKDVKFKHPVFDVYGINEESDELVAHSRILWSLKSNKVMNLSCAWEEQTYPHNLYYYLC